MNMIAFVYHARRGGEEIAALVGGTVSFHENVEYVIEFAGIPTPLEIGRMTEIGYEAINSRTGVLCFRNYVGTAYLSGVTLNVKSVKLGEDGVSRLLEDVSLMSASLVFGWRAPTTHAASASRASRLPVPYHQLQFLRQVVLRNVVGTRMQDYLNAIENNPTRRFVLERPVVTIERARRLDERSIREIFTRTERLAVLPASSGLNSNAVAKALSFGSPPRRHFPVLVSEASRKFSYDTVENRFIKYFIEQALAVVYKLLDNKAIHPQLRADCRTIATIFESASSARYLSEVKSLSAFPSPTQVMLKSEGYKEVWQLWSEFSSHMSLPTDAVAVDRFLQGKDIAQLYEYWVFLKVIEATAAVLKMRQSPVVKVSVSDLGTSLDRGLSVEMGYVKISFNPTFARSRGDTYSTPLRPDVVLEFDGRKFIFDAKYRLKWKDLKDELQEEESTFLRADLYKMHTYRDAIRNVEAAFVVYPGTEFGFYERSGLFNDGVAGVQVFDGVGAIPASPDTGLSPSALHATITRILDAQPKCD